VNNGSSPVNGQPRELEICVWPQCRRVEDRRLKLFLCQEHATQVYATVREDIERTAAILRARREVPAAAPVKPPGEEVIYYLQVGGHIKIGWTSQIEQRMRAYPPNTTLLAVHPGTRAEEKALHKRFAVHRSHGQEWYPLVPVVLDHIKRVVAEHGAPAELTFGARPVEVRRTRKKATLQAKYGPTLRA
jgi:hypothetical protein